MPVIGFLHSRQNPMATRTWSPGSVGGWKTPASWSTGTSTIEFHWANDEPERLPMLAADLVRRRVAMIVAGGGAGPALAAKAATSTIPIVVAFGFRPVKLRPGRQFEPAERQRHGCHLLHHHGACGASGSISCAS